MGEGVLPRESAHFFDVIHLYLTNDCGHRNIHRDSSSDLEYFTSSARALGGLLNQRDLLVYEITR